MPKFVEQTASTPYTELPALNSVDRCPKCAYGSAGRHEYRWESTNVWGGAMRRTCARCHFSWFERSDESYE